MTISPEFNVVATGFINGAKMVSPDFSQGLEFGYKAQQSHGAVNTLVSVLLAESPDSEPRSKEFNIGAVIGATILKDVARGIL